MMIIKKLLKQGLFVVALFLTLTNSLNAQHYELAWSDEFEYTGLPDSAKWTYDVGGHGWGNNELQYYTKGRLENVNVKDGKLVIKAIEEDYKGNQYTSTRLLSKNHGDWLYGKFEIKAKLPGGKGLWPAIWMLPTDWEYGGWPKSGEIDIMEYVGYKPDIIHGTVHTESFNHRKGTQKGDTIIIENVEDDFHLYSMVWTKEKIETYVDSTKYFTFENKENHTFMEWPFDKRFHLIMNVAVGGDWGGAEGVDESVFPQQMEVDYVRVYVEAKNFTE